MRKQVLLSVLLFVSSLAASVLAAEGILRLKNSSMQNYDIEMWRYARELKAPSPRPELGHDHIKNASAILQSVEIRTNEWKLRGGPVLPRNQVARRILFLGGSITLGWGVPEGKTITSRVEAALREKGESVDVLNGGVGNYNAERYVQRFFYELKGLEPTDIVVQYFLRDAEKLDPTAGNWFLRHSELAVTIWIAINRLLNKSGERSLVEHYQDVYRDDQPGFIEMQRQLRRLAEYADKKNIRLYLAMTPDVHNLKDYPFGFIHDKMRSIAQADGYTFVDLLPVLGKLSPEQIWAMPGDPHPNPLGHKLMAEGILPVLDQ
ncbi:GDSL-type esterase/lipase family protein [Bradyrhizobium sp. CB82]|uniref:SGNH/GDSL hydrolase family protein n=1 Tax=Bradyrhizobium sp. CB82 TaxID=3039159 RepID=UPI0024B21FA1|nr:GDSL-type esterase/lipase family protein [Bradyrhizobium sp. CB82]WFU40225.1 GDSL-type esterase/lipase family protein [Bradyrhizobium sp. CB82]